MFTLIECEVCGRPIGAGRLTCPKCGAGQSVENRVTYVWENVPNPVDTFFEQRKSIDRLIENAELVSHIVIGDIFNEIQYTDPDVYMNKFLYYHLDGWNGTRSWRLVNMDCQLWMMHCPDRYRFMVREETTSPDWHIFEVESWLIQGFRDKEAKIELKRKEIADIQLRKEEWEKKRKKLERKKRAAERKRVKDEKIRMGQELAKEMYKELENAYKKDKFGKYKKSMGFVPKEMSRERFLEIKKVLKEFNV